MCKASGRDDFKAWCKAYDPIGQTHTIVEDGGQEHEVRLQGGGALQYKLIEQALTVRENAPITASQIPSSIPGKTQRPTGLQCETNAKKSRSSSGESIVLSAGREATQDDGSEVRRVEEEAIPVDNSVLEDRRVLSEAVSDPEDQSPAGFVSVEHIGVLSTIQKEPTCLDAPVFRFLKALHPSDTVVQEGSLYHLHARPMDNNSFAVVAIPDGAVAPNMVSIRGIAVSSDMNAPSSLCAMEVEFLRSILAKDDTYVEKEVRYHVHILPQPCDTFHVMALREGAFFSIRGFPMSTSMESALRFDFTRTGRSALRAVLGAGDTLERCGVVYHIHMIPDSSDPDRCAVLALREPTGRVFSIRGIVVSENVKTPSNLNKEQLVLLRSMLLPDCLHVTNNNILYAIHVTDNQVVAVKRSTIDLLGFRISTCPHDPSIFTEAEYRMIIKQLNEDHAITCSSGLSFFVNSYQHDNGFYCVAALCKPVPFSVRGMIVSTDLRRPTSLCPEEIKMLAPQLGKNKIHASHYVHIFSACDECAPNLAVALPVFASDTIHLSVGGLSISKDLRYPTKLGLLETKMLASQLTDETYLDTDGAKYKILCAMEDDWYFVAAAYMKRERVD